LPKVLGGRFATCSNPGTGALLFYENPKTFSASPVQRTLPLAILIGRECSSLSDWQPNDHALLEANLFDAWSSLDDGSSLEKRRWMVHSANSRTAIYFLAKAAHVHQNERKTRGLFENAITFETSS